MPKKIKIKREVEKNIYIHNDIANAAYHLRTRIESNKAGGNEEGISLDIMSCLIMLAFEFEAKVNFIGHMKIKGWKEREKFHKKVNKICKELGLKIDRSSRPYSTIEKLKSYRDSIAHGKPTNISHTEETEILSAEIDRNVDLDNGLYDLCTIEFMTECKEDINQIWNEWLTASGIEIHKTITHGSFSATVL